VDTNQPIDIFPLFGKNESGCLFKEQQVQEAFDTYFKRLQASGQYQEIFRKYIQ
jgi:ABC-type amino acid transport substrate-binding protein